MGSFLDKPKTEKETDKGARDGADGFSYGMASMQGWRMEMEDAHTAEVKLPLDSLTKWSFFMVFDGHAGGKVAKEAGHRLLGSICETDYFKNELKTNKGNIVTENSYDTSSVTNAIQQGFLMLDRHLKEEDCASGSTAVGLLITPRHFFYINCGDSRAVHVRKAISGFEWSGLKSHQHSDYTVEPLEVPRLERGDPNSESQMQDAIKREQEEDARADTAGALEADRTFVYFGTKDHKPTNVEEQERIEKAGGIVLIQRINGALAVSRALGDFDYKRVDSLSQTEQMVSPMPVVTCIERTIYAQPESKLRDSYAIIACDGIYDAITNENLEKYITWKLKHGETCERIARDACDLCLNLGSRDNMTIVILKFEDGKPAEVGPDAKDDYNRIMERTQQALDEHKQYCEEKQLPVFNDIKTSDNASERLIAYAEHEDKPTTPAHNRPEPSKPEGFYHHWIHKNNVPGGHLHGGYIQFKSNIEFILDPKEAT